MSIGVRKRENRRRSAAEYKSRGGIARGKTIDTDYRDTAGAVSAFQFFEPGFGPAARHASGENMRSSGPTLQSALIAAVFVSGGMAQNAPGDQRLLSVKKWTGTVKISRAVSMANVAGPGGAPSSFASSMATELRVNLDKFDGVSWKGTAEGTFKLDETLRSEFPCESLVRATAGTKVQSSQFALILDFRGGFSFGSLDPPFVTGETATRVNCSGTIVSNTGPTQLLWLPIIPPYGLPIPAAGYELRGTQKVKGLSALNAMVLDHDVTWDLTPEVRELELIVEPSGHNTWRPQAARNGEDPGNVLSVTARLQYTDGTAPQTDAHKADSFLFELLETSKEPGTAMNWPRDASDSDFDLRFERARDLVLDDPVKRQRAEKMTGAPMVTATVNIESFDWGAWSRLKVTAELGDGRKITGHLKGDKDQTEVRIPKRTASSFIADAWRESKGIFAPDSSDDDEMPEGDGNRGDGLTLYEEYRGFYVNQERLEGNPKKKDYFAVNLAGSDGDGGLALFHRSTGLAVHGKLLQTELSAGRVINKNFRSAPHRVDQHGIIIRVQGFSGYAQAVHASGADTPSTPKDFSFVGLPVSIPSRRTSSAAVSYASALVAHELLHTVNVYHHGDSDASVTWTRGEGDTVLENGAGPIRIFREDGTEVTARVVADIVASRHEDGGRYVRMWLGSRNGQHSGFENCLMRYDAAGAYKSEADSSVRYSVREVPGTRLCDTIVGVDVNAQGRSPQSRYGSAISPRGVCRRQILVNDGVAAPGR
jgi:hypothetical protein